jgi:hypothetical protein
VRRYVVFEDERGAPRHPVNCARCGVCVLVKKNSLAHTVVQWTTSTEACGELSSATRSVTVTCAFLRDSIDAAVATLELAVGELDRLPISGNPPVPEP